MALPNTDKDTFCALWKLEKETGLSIFAELTCWVRAYNVEKEESSTFAECCRPFHECKEQNLADTERFLERKCEKLLAAVAKMEEIGLPVEESVINMAKVFINA